jgi:hypothetical protein
VILQTIDVFCDRNASEVSELGRDEEKLPELNDVPIYFVIAI